MTRPGDGVVVSRRQLEELRDELDRSLQLIDDLCRQRPHLVVMRAYLEGLVGSRDEIPTDRPPPDFDNNR